MISRRRRASSSVPKTYRRGCGALLNAIDYLYAELCSVVEVGDVCSLWGHNLETLPGKKPMRPILRAWTCRYMPVFLRPSTRHL